MIKRSYSAGVDTIIATPHYLPWNKDIIAEKIPSLCAEAMERARTELNISIKIVPGQELYYHMELPEAIKSGRALTLAGTNTILLEFSEQISARQMLQALLQLKGEGYQVILAHCERFACLREKFALDGILENGVKLQSNVHPMEAGVMDKTRRWLTKLYHQKLISFIGSDMHNLTTRPPMSAESLKWFKKNLEPEYYRQISYYNAKAIVDDYKA